ncbi:Rv3235 family protein [Streptomyces sp.]|uniref:Rv3235 family protein n=1 Tax=Streptomyces sp. TaxID=1931 RepID=UPI002D60EC7A|nr:Rv3235 family protein [Streptomyces sp.]HZF88475.1 Rv3235 family protein [Streptomyces sp.]
MNKVMTRTQHHPATHPGTRPPTRRDTRRDTRRPGGAPPRVRHSPTPLDRTADGLHPAAPPTSPAPLRVPPRTPRRPVPQPRPTDVFADRLLLVLSGRRPVHSMLGHTVGRAYDDLAHLAETGPLRSPGPRPVVRDVGYYVPRPGAFEAFARIGTGDRLRAMAFRLELGRDHRWRCTAVELDGPRQPRADDD